ncbi:hypothetical protein ANN_23047 [Periplaneta americana]|uniref:Uncharacterized protein n=1 Tax=Periplaneta americana TaxID=6978 RepID=A0ABQ8SK05_PERAM|nr:hypothetical protein ANN_23047 [Periplaneta americana]
MPSTWPGIEPATLGIEGQRYTNSPTRSTTSDGCLKEEVRYQVNNATAVSIELCSARAVRVFEIGSALEEDLDRFSSRFDGTLAENPPRPNPLLAGIQALGQQGSHLLSVPMSRIRHALPAEKLY